MGEIKVSDVNCDSTTNALDLAQADLNGDGVVNVADDHNRDGVIDSTDKNNWIIVKVIQERAYMEFAKGESFPQVRAEGIALARNKGLSSQEATTVGQTGTVNALGRVVADRVPGDLKERTVQFDVPTEMRLGDTELVKAVILPKLSETLRRESEEEGESKSATIKVDDQMQATVEGVHFDYEPQEPVNQLLSPGSTEPTQWSWQVTPTSSGPELLTLKVIPQLNIEGTLTTVDITPLNSKVEVTQPWGQRLTGIIGADWWEWVWAGLLVPIAVWAWGKYKRRRERQEETGR